MDLATAALQFSLRDDRFASTIVGFSKRGRIAQIMSSAGMQLPEEVWDEVAHLLPGPSAWLDHQEDSADTP